MDTKTILTGIVTILAIYALKKYCIDVYNYWKKRGIPSLPSPLPLLGHTFSSLVTHRNFVEFCDDVYKSNKNRSMVGLFQLRKPNLMVLDPELIKSVLINDFPKFHMNTVQIEESVDPLLAQNPFFTTGEKWKFFRSLLSHALMSVKRLRIIGQSVNRVSHKFEKYLIDSLKKSNNEVFEFEAKELGNLFTGEVVSNAAFGVEGDFFSGGSGPNSFRESVQGFFSLSIIGTILQTIIFFAPKLNKIFRIPFIPRRTDKFFRRVVKEMVEIRQKDGILRNDFLQVMLDDHKCEDEHGNLNLESLTAHATSFFVDGYETSAVTLGFLMYELAKNPEIQEKLREEVINVLDKHNGQINYDSISEMTYMDQTLSESQRLFPALGFITKKCSSPCKLVGYDGLECEVEPGVDIVIPIYALHMDERYYEKPEVYDPERFNEENKKNRPKTVFMPFGEGPRMCVGMRMAIMQIKAAIATILKDYQMEISSKTKEPLVFERGMILTTIQGGIWINLKKR